MWNLGVPVAQSMVSKRWRNGRGYVPCWMLFCLCVIVSGYCTSVCRARLQTVGCRLSNIWHMCSRVFSSYCRALPIVSLLLIS